MRFFRPVLGVASPYCSPAYWQVPLQLPNRRSATVVADLQESGEPVGRPVADVLQRQVLRRDHARRPDRDLVVAEPGDAAGPARAGGLAGLGHQPQHADVGAGVPPCREPLVHLLHGLRRRGRQSPDVRDRVRGRRPARARTTFKAKIADFGEYAIDGEPITVNGQQYFVWTGPGRGQGGPAQLYIVRMSNPWTATGGRVAIPADGGCSEVREGPTPLYGNGRCSSPTRRATPASRTTNCG